MLLFGFAIVFRYAYWPSLYCTLLSIKALLLTQSPQRRCSPHLVLPGSPDCSPFLFRSFDPASGRRRDLLSYRGLFDGIGAGLKTEHFCFTMEISLQLLSPPSPPKLWGEPRRHGPCFYSFPSRFFSLTNPFSLYGEGTSPFPWWKTSLLTADGSPSAVCSFTSFRGSFSFPCYFADTADLASDSWPLFGTGQPASSTFVNKLTEAYGFPW